MRISEKNLNIIKTAFQKNFISMDHLWVFGSRIDENKLGGDLDFYIETQEKASIAVKRKMAFVSDLWRFLGEQKIDVVLNLVSESSSLLPIHKIAKEMGIQIV